MEAAKVKRSFIARYFQFDKYGTNVRTEVLAGITTFFAMAYILLVNPDMLSKTGMDFGAVFVATAVASALGTLLMGIIANYPLALAPGMGLNAYFTFTICLGMKIPWQTALGAVFISGVIFLLLTVTKVREMIINSIPPSLKFAVSAGIGLFVSFIGLKESGIVVANPATFVSLSPKLVSDPMILLTLFGLIVTIILMVRNVKGAIFIGMMSTAIVGIITNQVKVPTAFFSLPPSIEPTFWKMDIAAAMDVGIFTIIFAFLFVDLFDNAGTLVGVANQAGFLKDNKLPRAGRALTTDSIAAMAGASLGTSTVTSYVESSAGVATGGRTGFTSVVTAFCFIASLFFFPIVKTLASVPAITAPALIIVGVLMASSLKDINWKELSESIPAFFTIIMMPLTFSIATGIALGFVLYPITKLVAGEGKKVHWLMYVLAVVFVVRFIYLNE
ncbi:AGZA family xanthine/uracil permease-like MFS transporter [Baia soyae]|uniref:AGZA family xanthine/uracil permease-like MFS transporter n=1 Tax=Baia soyae TaxID=1544746 RepID=A0A4R2RNM6_9BACL|nr:NCS2 family permease [Baia soyae]TCP60795.1 AGZA family xanthine/uracil permease-like MFS transporter [Baia soyae]